MKRLKRLLWIPLLFLCSTLWAADSCEPIQIARMNPYIAGVSAASGDNCTGTETMGYVTDTGDTAIVIGDGQAYAWGPYTATCTGKLATAHLYASSSGYNSKLGVFEDVTGDGSAPASEDTLVEKSNQITSTGAGTFSAVFSIGNTITKNKKYWLVMYGGDGANPGWAGRRQNGNGALFSDYDSSCNGFDGAYTQILGTGEGECEFPTDDGYQGVGYVTLSAP